MKIRHALAAGLLLASTPVLADEPILVTADGLSLKVTAAGFDLLGQVAKDEFINRLQNHVLADQEVSIPLIARTKIEDISFTVNLKQLAVKPGYDQLHLDALVDNVEINIGHIRFENWLIPFLGTSCYATQLNIGNHNDLPLGGTIGATLGDPDFPIELRLQDLRFDLNRGQYASRGPGDCRGPFEIQDIFTKYVVSSLLAYARPAIEAAIKVELVRTVPKVEDALNDMTAVMLPVDLPDLVVVPAASFNVGFKPNALRVTPDDLSVKLEARVQKRETESLARPAGGREEERAPLTYGTFGVNPQFLSHFAQVAVAKGTTPIGLYPEMHEFIKILTNRWELASFWPDLEAAPVDGEVLKLYARFVTPPSFALDAANDAVVMHIPHLELKYQVRRNGKWVDYAYLDLKASIGFGLTIDAGQLAVSVRPGATIDVQSRWAPTYTPDDPTVRLTLAQSTFQSILNLLGGRTTPAFEFPVPAVPAAGRLMTVDQLKIDGPFVKFDLVDAQR